jgi:hypothetical protein
VTTRARTRTVRAECARAPDLERRLGYLERAREMARTFGEGELRGIETGDPSPVDVF